jgi:beta-lactamase superfamily II metal-dependent hydrolase
VRRALPFLLLLALLAGCGAPAPAAGLPGAELEVMCFAAGKADAFLLTTADSAVLIDAGERGFGKEILACLEEKGVRKLDCLIITHFDQDHVGGAAKVLNNFPVGQVLQSDCPRDSTEYEKYLKALAGAGLEAVTVTETLAFTLDGVRYEIDPPRKTDYEEDDSNNSSLIVSVRDGEDRPSLYRRRPDGAAGRVPLRGRRPLQRAEGPPPRRRGAPAGRALEKTAPQYAVITSSDDEPEADAALAALEAAGVQVFLTRQDAVVIKSDGETLSVRYEAAR